MIQYFHDLYMEIFPMFIGNFEFMYYILDVITFMIIIKISMVLPSMMVPGGRRW